MNLPNLLSFFRLLLAPLLYPLYQKFGPGFEMVAALLVLGATDVLDGYLARQSNQVTPFGQLVDPLADKLLALLALWLLVLEGVIPRALVVVLAGKEGLQMLGAFWFFRRRRYTVPANWLGKGAAVLIFSGALLGLGSAALPARWLVFGGVGLSVAAGLNYLRIAVSARPGEKG